MARMPRPVLPDHPHIVLQRARASQVLFLDAEDAAAYLTGVRQALRLGDVRLHAYGLLPAEARLILTPTTPDALARAMQTAGRVYARWFNARYGESGSPTEGRFRSAPFEASTHWIDALLAVEAARSLSSRTVWKSSHFHHVGQRADPLITEHPALYEMGNTPFEREDRYRQAIEESNVTREAQLLHQAGRGWAIGDEAFISKVERVSGVRARPAMPGRPRKST